MAAVAGSDAYKLARFIVLPAAASGVGFLAPGFIGIVQGHIDFTDKNNLLDQLKAVADHSWQEYPAESILTGATLASLVVLALIW